MVPSQITLMVGLGQPAAIHMSYSKLVKKVCNHSKSDITVQFQFFNFKQLYQFLSHQG